MVRSIFLGLLTEALKKVKISRFFGTCNVNKLSKISRCTEVRFVSLLSGGFTTVAVINQLESKMEKRTYVHCGNFCGVHLKCKHVLNRWIGFLRAVLSYKYDYWWRLWAQSVLAWRTVNNTTKLPVLTISRGSSYTCCQIYLCVFLTEWISIFYKPDHCCGTYLLIKD